MFLLTYSTLPCVGVSGIFLFSMPIASIIFWEGCLFLLPISSPVEPSAASSDSSWPTAPSPSPPSLEAGTPSSSSVTSPRHGIDAPTLKWTGTKTVISTSFTFNPLVKIRMFDCKQPYNGLGTLLVIIRQHLLQQTIKKFIYLHSFWRLLKGLAAKKYSFNPFHAYHPYFPNLCWHLGLNYDKDIMLHWLLTENALKQQHNFLKTFPINNHKNTLQVGYQKYSNYGSRSLLDHQLSWNNRGYMYTTCFFKVITSIFIAATGWCLYIFNF